MPKYKHITDERIFKVMDHAGGSKKDFCEKIGAAPGNLQNIRNGTQSFTIPQILQCCKVFGVSADYLFGFTDKMNRVSQSNKREKFISEIEAALKKVKTLK